MKTNLNQIDSYFRYGLTALAFILYITDIVPSTDGIILIGIGLVFLITGLFKFCPVYFIFGLNTRNEEINPNN
ncbi:DUF2892 domain-containing protein [Candidatus Kapabacteria bacterium]|nr:DUF2892 domain-containing protein [Candidatus Kapabacteria bacterium]